MSKSIEWYKEQIGFRDKRIKSLRVTLMEEYRRGSNSAAQGWVKWETVGLIQEINKKDERILKLELELLK